MPFSLQCCICLSPVDASSERPLDPCSLTVHANADRDARDQRSQMLWAHSECFAKVLGNPKDLLLDELETPAEYAEEEHEIAEKLEQVVSLASASDKPFRSALGGVPMGQWAPAFELARGDAELEVAISRLERAVGEQLLVTRTSKTEDGGQALIFFQLGWDVTHFELDAG